MKYRKFFLLIALAISLATAPFARSAGTYMSSAGPVNQAMGGASTAAPIEAIGATFWNPATTSALGPELSVGFGLLQPIAEASSSIGGLGAGTTTAEPGVAILPNVGWVHRNQGSALTFALGIHALGGYKTNYPSSTTNPIFTPQANAPGPPGGLGRVFSGAEFVQIAPTLSYAVSDRFSIAVGPTLTMGQLWVDPLLAVAPDDADGSTVPTYGSGRGTRVHWGGGVQLGMYYIADCCWHFGASIKSPQWMENFRFNSEDELGRPRTGVVPLDLPMIVSLGTAYSGRENWVFAMDARFQDYANTEGWGPHGFKPDGSLNGLGQSSAFELGMGAQYRLSDRHHVRAGYTYNSPLYQDAEATGAVVAPLIYQHQIHFGSSCNLTDCVSFNWAYSFWPESVLSGPLVTPLGPVPDSNVETKLIVHHLTVGVGVRY